MTPHLVTSCGRPLTQRPPGPVKVTVQVADNGNLPATASQEFTINVGDDLAQFTELTSIAEVDGRREFWLSDKHGWLIHCFGQSVGLALVASMIR